MGIYTILSLVLTFSLSSRSYICHALTHTVDCLKSDREALLNFKNSLEDPENQLITWKGSNCCEWPGILCGNTSREVIGVDLGRYGISGNISSSLINLKSLTYLDLSLNNFGGVPIPEFFGSISNLRYMNLSKAGFGGVVSPLLGNLPKLEYLDISADIFSSLAVKSLEWVTGFRSLKHLTMDGVVMSTVRSNWLQYLNKLSLLTELHLSACGLSGSIASLDMVNLTSLAVVDFSFNSFNSEFPDWMVNISSLNYIDMSNAALYGRIPLGMADLPNLQYLNLAMNNNLSANCVALFKRSWSRIKTINLATNKLHGKLPFEIGNMISLVELDLSVNNVDGGIPSSIGKLCSLQRIDLSSNNLTGSLPGNFFGTESCILGSPLPNLMYLILSNNELAGTLPAWLGQLTNLVELSLSYNLFEGPIPTALGALQNLESMGLGGNKLNGTLPTTLGQLSMLYWLDVASNQLTGVITEAHFTLMSNLRVLRLSSNSLTVSVDMNWVPPFQVVSLDMGSCQLGPSFPAWLKSQKRLMYIDLSNNSISGSVPYWFWDLSANLLLLNMSLNHLQGQLPNPMPISAFADVDLSSNLFHGPIPLPTVEVELFQLSNNNLTGAIPPNIGEVIQI